MMSDKTTLVKQQDNSCEKAEDRDKNKSRLDVEIPTAARGPSEIVTCNRAS